MTKATKQHTTNDSERLTVTRVREHLAGLGMTLATVMGEYRVTFKGEPASSGYFTSSLRDARDTAHAMYDERQRPSKMTTEQQHEIVKRTRTMLDERIGRLIRGKGVTHYRRFIAAAATLDEMVERARKVAALIEREEAEMRARSATSKTTPVHTATVDAFDRMVHVTSDADARAYVLARHNAVLIYNVLLNMSRAWSRAEVERISIELSADVRSVSIMERDTTHALSLMTQAIALAMNSCEWRTQRDRVEIDLAIEYRASVARSLVSATLR